MSFRIGRDISDGRERLRASETRWCIDRRGDIALEKRRVNPAQLARLLHPPGFVELSSAEPLAVSGAPEYQHLGGEQPAGRRDPHRYAALQSRLIEQNGFLRQPFEPCTIRDIEANIDLGIGTQRAIDFFRGGAGRDHGRGGAQIYRQPQPVSTSQSARSGEKDRERQIAGLDMREEHAAGRALIQMREYRLRSASGKADFGRAVAALQSEGRSVMRCR